MKLVYIGMTGTCFTNGKTYLVSELGGTKYDDTHYVLIDNEGDEVYARKDLFK